MAAELNQKTVKDLLRELRTSHKLAIRPTHVLFRPEDVDRIAKIRGVDRSVVVADLLRAGAKSSGG